MPNLTDSFETNIVIYACSNNVVASNSGTLFVAKPTETVSNSVAGYPLQDSRFALSWDGWDRLTSMESTNANPNFRVECSYFADGQRASKVVYTNANGTWIGHSTNVYTYDGWNLISETQVSGLTSQVLHYVWSLDLQGQKDGKWGQAAGGIGGLISIAVSDGGAVTNTYFPFSDHQGTVHGLRDGSGQIVAQYFYTPYGAVIGESGAAIAVCPFRFQSQYLDRETGVYQWKKRYYDPVLCRWLSRDPLAEQADPNLFRFCGSDPVGRIDPLGLATRDQWSGQRGEYKGRSKPDQGETKEDVAKYITGDAIDSILLKELDADGWYDIAPLLKRLEEKLRSNVVVATRKISCGWGHAPSVRDIRNEAGINAFFGGAPPVLLAKKKIQADCEAGAALVMAKGLADTLQIGEFDRLYQLSSVYTWVPVVGMSRMGNLLEIQRIKSIYQMEKGDWCYLEGRPAANPYTGENLIRTGPGTWWAFGGRLPMNYPDWEALLKEKAGRAVSHIETVRFLNVSRIAMDVFDLRNKDNAQE